MYLSIHPTLIQFSCTYHLKWILVRDVSEKFVICVIQGLH